MAFEIIELKQGSSAWLEWRHRGIGGSDTSTIMGENRFKSVEQLLAEKRGPVVITPPNLAMRTGTKLEPIARRIYSQQTANKVAPACLQSTKYEWLRVSLDGFCAKSKSVVEIKCGKSAYWQTARTGKVPNYYYGQLQHILAITDLPRIDFWCYWPECEPILKIVPRNDHYIQRLLEAELQFWTQVNKGRRKKIVGVGQSTSVEPKGSRTSKSKIIVTEPIPNQKALQPNKKRPVKQRIPKRVTNKFGRELTEWERSIYIKNKEPVDLEIVQTDQQEVASRLGVGGKLRQTGLALILIPIVFIISTGITYLLFQKSARCGHALASVWIINCGFLFNQIKRIVNIWRGAS